VIFARSIPSINPFHQKLPDKIAAALSSFDRVFFQRLSTSISAKTYLKLSSRPQILSTLRAMILRTSTYFSRAARPGLLAELHEIPSLHFVLPLWRGEFQRVIRIFLHYLRRGSVARVILLAAERLRDSGDQRSLRLRGVDPLVEGGEPDLVLTRLNQLLECV
jgi:hypothetical protein